jgi:hypothetical protein
MIKKEMTERNHLSAEPWLGGDKSLGRLNCGAAWLSGEPRGWLLGDEITERAGLDLSAWLLNESSRYLRKRESRLQSSLLFSSQAPKQTLGCTSLCSTVPISFSPDSPARDGMGWAASSPLPHIPGCLRHSGSPERLSCPRSPTAVHGSRSSVQPTTARSEKTNSIFSRREVLRRILGS